MKSFRRLALLASVASAVIATGTAVSAQSTSSSLRVQVVDPTGTSLSGVSVTIIHVPTGREYVRTSNDSGVLSARGLPVGGPYVVRLTDQSLVVSEAPNNINDLQLGLGEVGDITLRANPTGQSYEVEEIIVTGEAAVRELRTGAGRDFGPAQITSIPSIGRDFVSVLETDSKILVDDSVPRGPAVSIAGANFRFNSVTVDGVAQNDNFGLSLNASATQRTPISIDAIEAINVNIAPYDVTYGNFLGGNINIVTKSGTNELHGSVYGFYTNDSLTGNRSGNDELAIGDFNEKTYGATLGGPIIKDKLFFFVNYEKFKTRRPANTQTIENIPGVTQADVDRAIDIFKNEYDFDPGNFAATDVDSDEKILVKLDWNINDSHRAVATYQRADGNVIFDDFPELAVLNSGRYNINERLDSYGVQLFSDWTDNFSTELKIGYKDVKNRQVSIDSNTPDFAIFTAGGGTIAAGGDRFRHNNTLDNTSRSFRLKADYSVGNHTITAGIEQERNGVNNVFLPFSRGQLTFFSLDDLEDRNVGFLLFGGSNTGIQGDADAVFNMATNTAYLQDEWYATDQLTLKFGVRYDRVNNNTPIPFNPNFLDRNGFSNTERMDGKDLFMPRLGFNYEANDRLTVRGGAGLFGGGTPMIMVSNSYAGNGRTRTFAGFFSPDFGPFISGLIDGAAADAPNADAVSSRFQSLIGAVKGGDVDAIAPDTQLLSSWKYNLAFDYVADLSKLGMGDDWNLTAELIYTDVKNGYDIYEGRRQEIGKAPDGRPIYSITDPDPDFTCFFNCADYIVTNTDRGYSTVVSLGLNKSFETDAGYFTMDMGYTYQDVKDVRSYNRFVGFETFAFDPQVDLNNPDLSTSRFEIPHRFTAAFSWEKELFGENKSQVSLVYTGRSGRNYSYVYGGGVAFGGNFLADAPSPDNPGPNLFYVPTGVNDPLVTGGANFLANLDARISADSCLDQYRGQIAPRNACRTGWVNQMNIRFLQEIEVMDGHKIELILDVENFGNLIDSDWGRLDTIFQPSNVSMADAVIENGQYVYTPTANPTASPLNPNVARLPSAYRVQFGVRYKF